MAKAVKAGDAFVEVGIKDKITSGLRGASRKLKAFGNSVQSLGASFLKVGAVGAGAFVLPLKSFAQFDDAMRTVKGVTQASGKDFEMLTDTAKRLGRTTSFTAVEVANLMTELGRAGFKPDQIDEMTASVLNLSRATGTEAAQAAGIMSATIRQFGLQAGDAATVADSLTAAANNSFNTVEGLGESLTYAGPVARDFGMSLEDTLAALGVLGNMGIQGSAAGTALRRMMIITGAEAQRMEAIFGGSFRDAEGNALPLVKILEQISRSTADMGTGERAAALNEAFGLLGITGASALAGNISSFEELQTAIKGAEGTAADTAKEMDGGIGGAFRRLMSAVEGISISVGEALAPALSVVADKLSAVSEMVTQFFSANKSLIATIAAVVAGILAGGVALVTVGATIALIGTALGGLATAITAVGAVLGFVGAVFAAVFSPFGIIIGLAVGAVYLFWDSLKQLLQPLKAVWDFAKQTFAGIADAVQKGDISRAWKVLTTTLELAWVSMLLPIEQAWTTTQNAIIDATSGTVNAVISLWRKASETLSKWFADMGYKASLLLSGEKDYLTDEERIASRDSAISSYYDDMEASARAALTTKRKSEQDALQMRLARLAEERQAYIDNANEELAIAEDAAKKELDAKVPGDLAFNMPGTAGPSASLDSTEYGVAAFKKFNDTKAALEQQMVDYLRGIEKNTSDSPAVEGI